MSAGTNVVLDRLFKKCEDGSFRNYPRWDDGYLFRMVVQEGYDIKTKDIVSADRGDGHVVSCGELALYLEHFKGVHWKKYGVKYL
jgi:hypothetical protein